MNMSVFEVFQPDDYAWWASQCAVTWTIYLTWGYLSNYRISMHIMEGDADTKDLGATDEIAVAIIKIKQFQSD